MYSQLKYLHCNIITVFYSRWNSVGLPQHFIYEKTNWRQREKPPEVVILSPFFNIYKYIQVFFSARWNARIPRAITIPPVAEKCSRARWNDDGREAGSWGMSSGGEKVRGREKTKVKWRKTHPNGGGRIYIENVRQTRQWEYFHFHPRAQKPRNKRHLFCTIAFFVIA